MSERDIDTIPWNELTEEEQDALRARDRQRFPDLLAQFDDEATIVEVPEEEL